MVTKVSCVGIAENIVHPWLTKVSIYCWVDAKSLSNLPRGGNYCDSGCWRWTCG